MELRESIIFKELDFMDTQAIFLGSQQNRSKNTNYMEYALHNFFLDALYHMTRYVVLVLWRCYFRDTVKVSWITDFCCNQIFYQIDMTHLLVRLMRQIAKTKHII